MRATEQFLRLIWPNAGNKAIVSISKGQVIHHWFQPDQVAEAATKAQELAAAGLDTYMGVAGFEAQARLASQAVAIKTLFIDIDCGDGKDYPDAAAGRAALDDFVSTAKLPEPLVVSSGFGLHVYWPLDEELNRDEWLVMATALKELCKQHGLHADEKCTADAARILRPNGTFNYKNGSPRRVAVQTVSPICVTVDLRERLLSQAGNVFEVLARQQAREAKGRDTSFSSADYPEVDFDDILPHCQTIRWAYENQDAVREPLWYAAVGLAHFCRDGSQVSHRLSQGHPAYDPELTDKKRNQWVDAVGGPPTCDYFRSCPGSHCDGCPARVSTPLHLGRPKGIVAAVTSILNNRLDFSDAKLRVDSNGMQIKVTPPPKDNQFPPPVWVKLGDYGVRPLLSLRMLDRDSKPVNHVWMETYDHLNVAHDQFLIPSMNVNQSAQFANEIAKYGMVNEQENFPTAFKTFTTIMRSWIRSLEQQQGAAITFDSFGWMGSDANKDSFLLGDKLYSADNIRTVPSLPHLQEYQAEMTQRGTLAKWTETMDHYNLPGMEAYMFASWAAWGAPLMEFTSSKNVVMSLVGDTGVGKSSLQRAIASVYGDYNSKILVDQHNSTINSVNANLGCLNSLPYIREEAAENDNEELSSWVLTMTQGRDRGRLNASLSKVPVKKWSTIAIVSSNTSVREVVINTRKDNQARLARVWEDYIFLPMKSDVAAQLFRPLNDNFGHAGPIFIDYIVKNREKVAAMVRQYEDQLMAKFKATGSDRFHISMIAACFVGAQIAIALGLIHHDFKRGRDYAYRKYRSLHQSAIDEQLTPEQMLATMIHDLRPTTLVVECDAPGSATTILDSNNNIIYAPSVSSMLNARFAADTSMFYVLSTTIRKWYVDSHMNYRTSMDALKAAGILVEENKKFVLTKGTRLADKKQSRVSCFDLSLSSELVDVIHVEKNDGPTTARRS